MEKIHFFLFLKKEKKQYTVYIHEERKRKKNPSGCLRKLNNEKSQRRNTDNHRITYKRRALQLGKGDKSREHRQVVSCSEFFHESWDSAICTHQGIYLQAFYHPVIGNIVSIVLNNRSDRISEVWPGVNMPGFIRGYSLLFFQMKSRMSLKLSTFKYCNPMNPISHLTTSHISVDFSVGRAGGS